MRTAKATDRQVIELARLQAAQRTGRLAGEERDRLRRILSYAVPEPVQHLLDLARICAVEPGWYVRPAGAIVIEDGPEHEIVIRRRPRKD